MELGEGEKSSEELEAKKENKLCSVLEYIEPLCIEAHLEAHV